MCKTVNDAHGILRGVWKRFHSRELASSIMSVILSQLVPFEIPS